MTLLGEAAAHRGVLNQDVEFATFYVGTTLLGIDICQIEEINRQLDLTRVPHAPAAIRGVVNLRGEVVTVVDLRTILGLEPIAIGPDHRNVIVRNGSEEVGLLVDRVADVVRCSSGEIEAPPANLNGIDGRFFKGICTLESSLLVVLNVEAALAAESH